MNESSFEGYSVPQSSLQYRRQVLNASEKRGGEIWIAENYVQEQPLALFYHCTSLGLIPLAESVAPTKS